MSSATAQHVSHVESQRPTTRRQPPGTPGSIVALPTGQMVLIIAPGIYQAISSGRITRTDGAH